MQQLEPPHSSALALQRCWYYRFGGIRWSNEIESRWQWIILTRQLYSGGRDRRSRQNTTSVRLVSLQSPESSARQFNRKTCRQSRNLRTPQRNFEMRFAVKKTAQDQKAILVRQRLLFSLWAHIKIMVFFIIFLSVIPCISFPILFHWLISSFTCIQNYKKTREGTRGLELLHIAVRNPELRVSP